MASLLASGLFLTTLASASMVSYDGFQAVRVPTGNNAARVADIVERLGLDTWKRTASFADVVVPPEKLDVFHDEVAGIDVEIMHEDLGVSVSLEKQSSTDAFHARGVDVDGGNLVKDDWFTRYHPYENHLGWIDGLQRAFPNNSRVVTLRESFEGNQITGIHIFGSAGRGVQPAVVFHGTVHAREWITTMVVEYAAFALLSNYSDDAEIRRMVDKYDFYLFPIVNPDGFKYTETDRLWRKNRQPTNGSGCVGRDINRNWPYMWDVEGGSSRDPCADAFRGEAAADAPETRALIAGLVHIRVHQGIKLYIDWHSYSQAIMWPYGYTEERSPENADELRVLAEGAAGEMMRPYGTTFTTGPVSSTIQEIAGCGVDYVQGILGGQYVYAVELRDEGRYGFLLPKEEIMPASVESFEGVKHMLANMK